jgi:hypothetical protein
LGLRFAPPVSFGVPVHFAPFRQDRVAQRAFPLPAIRGLALRGGATGRLQFRLRKIPLEVKAQAVIDISHGIARSKVDGVENREQDTPERYKEPILQFGENK